ncbi:hypothetical protein CM240_0402 [Clostridium bornimense]|uniref:ABC3 transporter permease C-terminal domain-containing protein n=1 Tax=Clostridium bornimense TaxID=1216932 RepID=W6RVD7_9CLOT|nr:FtsX-like permease family protein [Clostridium bornimense]CDM67569.1 hypothetical protein CM240_0402 [Clostridium bornimense]
MKFENNNKEVIKRITKRSLKSNKVRNIFTILAIVLTTFMISSVFSIGISFLKNYKTMNLRLQGNKATTFLEKPTESQINKIKSLKLHDSIGYEINVGKVVLDSLTKNKTSILIRYSDEEDYEKQMKPCISDIEGKYPEKENEVMASKKALKFLGKGNAKIGDKIKVPCNINGEVVNNEFVLSGYYTTYGIIEDAGYLLVSEKFVHTNNLSLEKNGTLFITIKNKYKNTASDVLNKEVSLKDNQKFNFNYDITNDTTETMMITIVLISIIALFIVLSGYLLIYNVLYIAVTKDINFYGLLKTIGTSPRQIKKIVKGQAIRISIIGIPVGLALGAIVSFVIVPVVLDAMNSGNYSAAMPSVVSFNPVIFIATTLFSLLTVLLSCRKPAKIASSISPTEALRYTGSKTKKQKKNRKSTNGGKLYKMAWYNVFREKKRAILVFLSLFMGIITFLSVNTFLNSISVENYIEKYVKNDFILTNESGEGDKIDEAIINKIKYIKGIKTVNTSKSSYLQLEMNEDVLLPAIKEVYKRFGSTPEDINEILKSIEEDPSKLSTAVIGIDDELITSFNEDSKEKIDIAAFKSGKLILLDSWSYGENYKNIKGNLTIKNVDTNDSLNAEVKVVNDNENVLPSGLPAELTLPTIYVSNSALEKLDSNCINYTLYINVDEKYESIISNKLKNLSNKCGVDFESKVEETKGFNNSQIVMNILGSGISIILIFIGILNFVNVMITGVNTRVKELAIMESIGMTKKQIKKMLTFEGLYYAVITTLFISTIGMAIIYGVYKLTKEIADYAAFAFPIVPLALLLIFIFLVCLVTPTIVFKLLSKNSVTDRIREE